MNELTLGFTPAARGSLDTGAWLRNWQPGQLLRAQVVNTPAAGSVTLRIGNHQVSANTQALQPGVFLQKGAWLNLQVTGLVPAPTVRVLDAPPRSTEFTSPLERHAQLLLPRQSPVLGPLMTLADPVQRVNLLSLLRMSGGALDSALDELLWPGPPRTPEALQKALLQSGLFFESDLARSGASAAAGADLKALLFRLLARIAQARGDAQASAETLPGGKSAAGPLASLQVEVEGALAALSLSQLAASQQRQQDAWIWVFHVPFKLREEARSLSITLRSETGDSAEAEPEREWKALLQLDLVALGELEVQVFLRGVRVSAVFYAQAMNAVRLLESTLDTLRRALCQHGFEVGVLRAHHGRREGDAADAFTGPGFKHRV